MSDFAIRKIVKLGMSTSFFVVDGFWDRAPTREQLSSPTPMGYPYGSRHLLPGQDDVYKGSFIGAIPDDFIVVHSVTLDARRYQVAQGTFVFQDAEHLRARLLVRYRELHDAPALEAERETAQRESVRERARREAERKANTTLETLLAEKPFASWGGHWGARIVKLMRATFATATKELIEVREGSAHAKKAVFTRLLATLNAIYDREGCIETGEATELVARIEEMGRLVGLDNANERLTGTRDW